MASTRSAARGAGAQDEGETNMAALLTAVQQSIGTLTAGQAALTDIVTRISTPAPPPAVAFHLSPAQSALNELLDLTTRAGKAIYEETKSGAKVKYDMAKEGLSMFIKEIQESAERLGCSQGTTSVCHFTPKDGEPAVNIIDHFGEVSKERIKTQSASFITGANRETRQAQNNRILYDYTINSLTQKAKKSLLTYESTFKLNGGTQPSWGLLWKQLVAVPSMDSKATARNLCREIRDMETRIPELSIRAWNEEFTNLMVTLEARKETISDVEDIILKAYTQAPDTRFVEYWTNKQREIDDNEGTLANATWKQLLAKGIEKFNGWAKDWGKLSKRDQDFLALSAKYESLRGQLEVTSAPNNSSKKSNFKPKGGASGGVKSSQTSKNKKSTTNKRRQKKDEAWKKIPPKDGEPTTKTLKNKKGEDYTLHWCIHHMAWCAHKSEECRLGKNRTNSHGHGPNSFQANSATTEEGSGTTNNADERHVDFMARLAALSNLHA